MKVKNPLNLLHNWFLSPKAKHRGEKIILSIAIISYVVHLFLIFLNNYGFIEFDSSFFNNPIAAIYTPFSFILVYEVYLVVFYLTKSISLYIGRQYEIITLIVIRRIFKDIANLQLTSDWFHVDNDLQFTFDILTSIILFFLIYVFYRNIKSRNISTFESLDIKDSKTIQFIKLKKTIATLLVPILIIFSSFTFFNWINMSVSDYKNGVEAFKNINNIFFDEFFTVLIIVDVLLLLASFFYSDTFYKIIRNSGFVISTILIKVSFSVEGLINNALVIAAVLFGLLILVIHNLYQKDAILAKRKRIEEEE